MLADAATENFSQASFDTLISRFGIMFFLDPVSAFAHLRKTLAPEGRVSLVCWRTMRENGWVSVPYAAALPHIQEPEKPVPGAPGPFAFADRDRFRDILEQAGYSGIEIEPFDASLTIGSGPDPVESALEQTMEIGPLSRAIKTLPEENRMRVLEAVPDALVREVANGEVRLDGAVWLVPAKACSACFRFNDLSARPPAEEGFDFSSWFLFFKTSSLRLTLAKGDTAENRSCFARWGFGAWPNQYSTRSAFLWWMTAPICAISCIRFCKH